jgi:hypothetical protein
VASGLNPRKIVLVTKETVVQQAVREKRPPMNLAKQLAPQKAAIVKQWHQRVLASYPKETARFLDSQQDPFQNPVGMNTLQSLQALIDLLGNEPEPAAVRKALDPVIRIRAIQDFTPSQAVGFVFELKQVIRRTRPAIKLDADHWLRLDQHIDDMAMAAFDVFMACREKIYDLKADDIRERTYKAFARAGLVKDPI